MHKGLGANPGSSVLYAVESQTVLLKDLAIFEIRGFKSAITGFHLWKNRLGHSILNLEGECGVFFGVWEQFLLGSLLHVY